MDKLELDKLIQDIKEIKNSVRKANPFLRDIMALRAYAIMSIPLGILLLADCILTHFLVRAHGSFAAIPRAWKIVTIAVFALIFLIGSVAKWIIVNRRAAEVRSGANFFTVVEAMYGGFWFNLTVPLMLCGAVSSVYAVLSGHPWLIVSLVAIFIGPLFNVMAKLLARDDYLYTGWYLTITGLASLFFVEAAPFAWLAIVWSGTFLVFAAAELAAGRPGAGGNP
jgi:hypothetical protein